MPDTLFERLERLRRRLVQLVSLYGASWVVAVVFAATLAAGTLDWLVHLDDPGIRLILGMAILATGGWIAWTMLIRPLRRSFSDVELALRIERRHPGFRDSLASTVQFLAAGRDARLGSPELQERVVSDTLARIERIDVDDVIETRDVRKAATAALIVCLTAAIVVATNQTAAATALHRLMFPFSSGAWPRETQLRLLTSQFEPVEIDPDEPLRAAQGSVVEFYVDNARGSLPDDVRLIVGREEMSPSTERLRRATVRDEAGRTREVCIAAIPAQRGPLLFRAVGGDDDTMPWRRLEVVPPPVLEEFRVTVTPPKYAARATEKLPPGVGHVQGLIGSRVDITATAEKPLGAARLRVKDAAATELKLSPDGRHFMASFVIIDPGVYAYWFDLKDRQGFENPEAPRYEVRAVSDLPPDVTIEEPPADLTVTPEADVPFRITARDDIGVRQMQLVHRLGDGAGVPTASIPLFDADAPRDSDDATPSNSKRRETSAPRPSHHTAEHVFRLKPLAPAPGMRILVHGEALDDYDLGGEHVGRSLSRVLTVVSPEDKSIELAARQSSLVDELEKIFRSQERSREQIGELTLQLEKAGRLQPDDIDLLKRIELDQKQIASRLADPSDSVESRTRAILRELDQNGLDDPAMKSRLEQLVTDLSLLREENLPQIEQELTRARKTVLGEPGGVAPKPTPRESKPRETKPNESKPKEGKPGSPDAKPPKTDAGRNDTGTPEDKPAGDDERGSLVRAEEQQKVVLDTLGEQLKKLSEWRSRRDLSGELSEMIAGQKQLNEETGEVGRRTLAKPESDLTPQERADLARVAERQSRQADRLNQFRAKMSDLADDLAETNPDAAETLRDAHEELRRLATADRLKEAAGELEKNNIGRATAAQQQALEEMNELQNALRDRAPSDTESLVKRLREAESQLESLRKREETLRKKLKDAAENDNAAEREAELERLRKEQKQIREEMEGLDRRLKRSGARSATDPARRSAGRMENAEKDLAGNDTGAADQEIQEALDDLEQAQREVAKQRRDAEEQLARELLEKIADEIRSMVERQQSVIDETNRLDEEFLNAARKSGPVFIKDRSPIPPTDAELRERGRWTRGQLKSLSSVAEIERSLAEETERLAEQIQAAEVFALALRGAARQMQVAATRLSERKTDAATVDAEKAALKRFKDLVESLRPEKSKAAGEKPPEGEPQKGQEGPATDGIPQLAQLKMLKTMQEDLLARTARLDELRESNGELTPDEQKEVDALALEQGQLADLARNLVKQFAPASEPEDDAAPQKDAPKEK